MTEKLTDKELLEVRKYFWQKDLNGDGRLSQEEFVTMCDEVGLYLADRQIERAFDKADKDHNGTITFAEFLHTYFSEGYPEEQDEPDGKREPPHKMTRVQLFRMASVNGVHLTNNVVTKAFEMADANEDGMITYDQFQSMCGECRKKKHSIKPIRRLTDEELVEMRHYFARWDYNGDGKIGWTEFNELVETFELDLTERQMNKAFDRVDRDNNSYISFAEFLNKYFAEGLSSPPTHHDKTLSSKDVIKKFNLPPSKKKLTRSQFVRTSSLHGIRLSDNAVEKAFDVADQDQDGMISLDEFENIFEENHDHGHNHHESNYKDLKNSDPDPNQHHHRHRHLKNQKPTLESQKSLDDEIAELSKYFWHSDKNADGKLSPEEFLKMLDTLGMRASQRQMWSAFSSADQDGDGEISFKEFANAYLNRDQTILTSKQMKGLFTKFDKDGNGVLSKEELRNALKMLGNRAGERRLKKMFEYIDKDDDDNVSLEEFCEFLDIPE